MESQQVDSSPVEAPAAAVHFSTAEAQVSAEAAQVNTEAAHASGVVLHVSGDGAQDSGDMRMKKRGRPRKYGPDGAVIHRPQAAAISPMPISASIPLTGDFPAWKPSRGRSVGSIKKKHKVLDFNSPGGLGRTFVDIQQTSPAEQIPYSVGPNFTPHVVTVNPGEDVNMKIISFSQQGSRAICVLSANGSVSNVTLRQSNSSGGTLTYEGRFEILSLTGSFMPSDNGGTKSRSGGMSVSLAGPDGRVYGGGLAGLLTAAGPVQVVIGSFLAGNNQEQKPKNPIFDQNTTIYAPSPLNHHPAQPIGGSYGAPHTITPSSTHISNHLSSENVINFGGSESNETNGSQKFDLSC